MRLIGSPQRTEQARRQKAAQLRVEARNRRFALVAARCAQVDAPEDRPSGLEFDLLPGPWIELSLGGTRCRPWRTVGRSAGCVGPRGHRSSRLRGCCGTPCGRLCAVRSRHGMSRHQPRVGRGGGEAEDPEAAEAYPTMPAMERAYPDW